MLYDKRKIQIIIGGFSLLILLIVAYYIYSVAMNAGKVDVSINTVPNDAKVTLNDSAVPANGTTHLEPGTYTLKSEKDGFETVNRQVFIDEPEATLVIPMTPISEAATAWATDNQTAYMELEDVAGVEAQQQGEAFRTKNPIVDLLPHYTIVSTIGYRTDPADKSGSSIIIEVDVDSGYEHTIAEQFKDWGYNPADFNIKFKNYESPFSL